MTEKLDTFITKGHGDIEFKKSLEEVYVALVHNLGTALG